MCCFVSCISRDITHGASGSPPPPPPLPNELPQPQFEEDDVMPQPEEDPYAATGPEMYTISVPENYLEKGREFLYSQCLHVN